MLKKWSDLFACFMDVFVTKDVELRVEGWGLKGLRGCTLLYYTKMYDTILCNEGGVG